MLAFIRGLLAWIGGFVALSALAAAGVWIWFTWYAVEPLPARIALTLRLADEIDDAPSRDPVFRLLERDRASMRDLLETLELAGADERVRALVVHLGAARPGIAQVQELRDAVLRFRARGKFALAFADSFGEFSGGGAAYLLASAFDEIWLQPSGDLGYAGLLWETPYLRGVLDRLGIEPQFDRRKEYKGAAEMLTETGPTPPARAMTERLAQAWHGQIVRAVAAARGLDPAAVEAAFARGPLLAPEARDARLVDRLGYWDEARARTIAKAEGEAVPIATYASHASWPPESERRIALVHGAGTIVRGAAGRERFAGRSGMAADSVAAALREAAADPKVVAIVLRLDSPGGSYVASDTIWREVRRARAGGKPVVVSMGDVAASGGYFIASAADRIVAQPGTLTGSIGVVAGKVVTKGLWDMLGVGWDGTQTGPNAAMWNDRHRFTASEWARLQAMLDHIYEDFTGRVAAGRGMTREAVEPLAGGRVWTGEEAKANGLVDLLGGYPEAIGEARALARVPREESVDLVVYPREKSMIETLLELLQDGDLLGLVASVRRAGELAAMVQDARGMLREVGVGVDRLEARFPAPRP